MIASRLHSHPSNVRRALLAVMFLVGALSVGASLATIGRQLVPGISGAACVSGAPNIVVGPAVPIMSAAPQIDRDGRTTYTPDESARRTNARLIYAVSRPASLPPVDLPDEMKRRYAISVHGRARGRFAPRD